MGRLVDFVDDYFVPVFIVVMMLCTVGLFVGLGYYIYDETMAETFTLRKDSWTCTESVPVQTTTYNHVGGTMIPMTTTSYRCVNWRAK